MYVLLYFICSRQSIVILCKFIKKQDHRITFTYHYKYIIAYINTLHYKILHNFAENPPHNVPQALAIGSAIGSELAISLRHWSNIDNWHAECV